MATPAERAEALRKQEGAVRALTPEAQEFAAAAKARRRERRQRTWGSFAAHKLDPLAGGELEMRPGPLEMEQQSRLAAQIELAKMKSDAYKSLAEVRKASDPLKKLKLIAEATTAVMDAEVKLKQEGLKQRGEIAQLEHGAYFDTREEERALNEKYDESKLSDPALENYNLWKRNISAALGKQAGDDMTWARDLAITSLLENPNVDDQIILMGLMENDLSVIGSPSLMSEYARMHREVTDYEAAISEGGEAINPLDVGTPEDKQFYEHMERVNKAELAHVERYATTVADRKQYYQDFKEDKSRLGASARKFGDIAAEVRTALFGEGDPEEDPTIEAGLGIMEHFDDLMKGLKKPVWSDEFQRSFNQLKENPAFEPFKNMYGFSDTHEGDLEAAYAMVKHVGPKASRMISSRKILKANREPSRIPIVGRIQQATRAGVLKRHGKQLEEQEAIGEARKTFKLDPEKTVFEAAGVGSEMAEPESEEVPEEETKAPGKADPYRSMLAGMGGSPGSVGGAVESVDMPGSKVKGTRIEALRALG